MRETPWWLATLSAPAAYYLLVGRRFPGFTGQPRLVLSWTADRFRSRCEQVGGTQQVERGVLVDVGFAVLLNAAVALVVAAADGPWWLLATAGVLDLLEGVVLLWIVRGGADRDSGVRLLGGVAVAKFAFYAAGLVAFVAAGWHLIWG